MAPRIYATIGRAPDNNVVIDDPTVSNHHARLSWSGAALVVEDLSSANGTYVDGQRVKVAKTRPGADVRIGQVPLTDCARCSRRGWGRVRWFCPRRTADLPTSAERAVTSDRCLRGPCRLR
jgi:hypothetical protein